jgi:hypothetical protein
VSNGANTWVVAHGQRVLICPRHSHSRRGREAGHCSSSSSFSKDSSHLRLPATAQLCDPCPRFRSPSTDGHHEGAEGGCEEGCGGDRAPTLLRRGRCRVRADGERRGRRRRREGGEPVHGRQPGAPHRPRHRSPVSLLSSSRLLRSVSENEAQHSNAPCPTLHWMDD